MFSAPPADVSVIIPTYNRAAFLLRAIRSVGRPCAATEIIVVDDGSTDGTAEILHREFPGQLNPQEAAGGPLIRFYSQSNKGAAEARNLGLQNASGTFIKFLDSDDLLIDGSLDKEVAYAKQTGVDVVVCGWIEQTEGRTPEDQPVRRKAEPPVLENGIDDMLCGRSVWTAAALYRRDFIQNLRWNPAHGKADDWGWVWQVCLAGAAFSRLPILSAVYCIYPGNRITLQGNPFLDSTLARQNILREVETVLRTTERLTPERAALLARYYLKDRIVLARYDSACWRQLYGHVRRLSPGLAWQEPQRCAAFLVRCLGLKHGIQAYAYLSGIFRMVTRPDATGNNRREYKCITK